ncbi:ATP-binding protein [Dielma fastidiosa]|uniref:ATP-binding protein n=1 Tax=Dielma fastidiosa TaxID=1034346 RepID=UPI0023F1764A|nr:hypothetical protein [Dielma fastidiosa]
MKFQAVINTDRCMNCRQCLRICQEHMFIEVNGHTAAIKDGCSGCNECVTHCPCAAIELTKKECWCCEGDCCDGNDSELYNWPVHLSMISSDNRYLPHADLLLAADCAAYAYADFHKEFMIDKVVLIACPKNDANHTYPKKLADMFRKADFHSIQIVRMNSDCCMSLKMLVDEAVQLSGLPIQYHEVVVSNDGCIYE